VDLASKDRLVRVLPELPRVELRPVQLLLLLEPQKVELRLVQLPLQPVPVERLHKMQLPPP